MTDRAKILKAELAVAEAEEAFIQAKKAYKKGGVSEAKYRKLKDEVRAARKAFREARDAGTANPEPVRAKARTR